MRLVPVLALGGMLLAGCAGGSVICIDGGTDCDATPTASVAQQSFANDITPDFVDCASGGCHDNATAQGLFNLDGTVLTCNDLYAQLTAERTDTDSGTGPRIETGVNAADTFLIIKASNSDLGGPLDHTGGNRLDPSSEEYSRWTGWINQGATNDCGS